MQHDVEPMLVTVQRNDTHMNRKKQRDRETEKRTTRTHLIHLTGATPTLPLPRTVKSVGHTIHQELENIRTKRLDQW